VESVKIEKSAPSLDFYWYQHAPSKLTDLEMDGRADETLPYLETSGLKLEPMSFCRRLKKLLSASICMLTRVSKEDETKSGNELRIRTFPTEARSWTHLETLFGNRTVTHCKALQQIEPIGAATCLCPLLF
jgi:hypothetical protein